MMGTKAYSNPLFEIASTSVGSKDSIILKVAIMSSRRYGLNNTQVTSRLKLRSRKKCLWLKSGC